MLELREETYLSPAYPSLEQLAKEVEFWDATSSQWVADCPRMADYRLNYHIVQPDEGVVRQAGKALHAGLNVLYTAGDTELALEALRQAWGKGPDFQMPPGHKFAHITQGHLETILKNYFDWRKKHDAFEPLIVHRDELDLTDVVAAVWQLTADDRVILGESKLVMRFEVTVGGQTVPFVYAGKPDLPIVSAGVNQIFDHKSTNSYLSEWYFSQYMFSNQTRGYAAMLTKLLQRPFTGCLINGLYMGERAAMTGFKGERFGRFGPRMYQPGHLQEAITNQYLWRQQLARFGEIGYFPQHPSRLCGSCDYANLCNANPATRPFVLTHEYVKGGTHFLDL